MPDPDKEDDSVSPANWDIAYVFVCIVRVFSIWSVPMDRKQSEIRNAEDGMALRFFSLFIVAWLVVLITPVSVSANTDVIFGSPLILAVSLTTLVATGVEIISSVFKVKFGSYVFINIYAYVAITLFLSGFIFVILDEFGFVAALKDVVGPFFENFSIVFFGSFFALIISALLLMIKSRFRDGVRFTREWFKDFLIVSCVTLVAVLLLLSGAYLPFLTTQTAVVQ